MKTKIIITGLLLFAITANALACTTAIISGKATKDGRPLLFKTADGNAETLRTNIYLYDNKGKYAFIGCARLNYPEMPSIFYGQNECGFAMVNNTAKDLDSPTPIEGTSGNIIRQGLENCATVDEFEALLNQLMPLTYGSNYACIDAHGGAAYFECGYQGYKRYDATDPRMAPKGYLVRTNYALSGNVMKGTGVSRYIKIQELVEVALAQGGVTVALALSWGRCLQHGLTRTNLYEMMPETEDVETPICFTDYIPRYTTGGMVVIEGVKEDENPLLTTSWLAMGNPLVTPVVPLWITDDGQLPAYVGKNHEGECAMGEWAMTLKDYIWAYKGGECYNYLALNRLINRQQTGITQQILEMERPIAEEGKRLLALFRQHGKVTEECKNFYNWVDQYVDEGYQKIAKSHGLKLRKKS